MDFMHIFYSILGLCNSGRFIGGGKYAYGRNQWGIQAFGYGGKFMWQIQSFG